MFRFRYQTDGGVHLDGAFLDALKVTTDSTTETDDVESGAGAWTPTQQWKISTGTETAVTPQYYLLENREYAGFDETLAEGPYQFSKPYTAPDWVEFFRFQNGTLVWYVDHCFEDNNTSEHAGGGLALPVDARPAPFTYPDGTRPSNRRQPFDATFGLEKTDETCLHKEVLVKKVVTELAACAPSARPRRRSPTPSKDAYWDASNPQNSVKAAGQTRSDRHGHERRR